MGALMHGIFDMRGARTLAIAAALAAGLVGLTPASANPPTEGSFDPNFGLGGAVVDWRNGGAFTDVVVQPDSKILAAYENGGIYRYTSAGGSDPSWGDNGVVRFGHSSADSAAALAIQPDGKVVAVGIAGNAPIVARYLSNGAPDPTFGSSGRLTIPVGANGNEPYDVAIQPDGKIVVAGEAQDADANQYVMRLRPGGALDPTFNPGSSTPGVVDLNYSGTRESARALALQSDGKIVVAGSIFFGSNDEISVLRLTPSGVLDPTFGDSHAGLEVTDVGTGDDRGYDVAVGRGGRIYVAGDSVSANPDAVVVRYTSAGTLDTSWGEAGHRVFDELGIEHGGSVALQRDGKVLLAGSTYTDNSSLDFHVLLARLNRDGTDDPSFGTPRVDLVGNNYAKGGGGLSVMRDGRIVMGGEADPATLLPMVLRFIGDATRPSATAVTIGAKTRTGRRPISWHATDDNTGVRTYTVQFKWRKRSATKFGSWHAFRTSTTAHKALFTPTARRRYCFRARARDWAGNTGPFGVTRCFSS